MIRNTIGAMLTVSLLILGPAGALAQASGGSDPHHPSATDEKSPPPAAQDAAPPPQTPGGMPAMMGMMTPEMMQMMQQMMRMQGDGPPEMMRGAGMGIGPGMFYGMAPGAQQEMTPERVRSWLEQRLARHANPRLKIGKIAAADGGEITAEIVTVDGSLVQKLAFNRYPGFVRVLR
jgi:hypothetical protein